MRNYRQLDEKQNALVTALVVFLVSCVLSMPVFGLIFAVIGYALVSRYIAVSVPVVPAQDETTEKEESEQEEKEVTDEG